MQGVRAGLAGMLLICAATRAGADESLLGYVKGAETLPQGALELDTWATYRTDKGAGSYDAWNVNAELEYGITNRLTASGYLKFQSIDTQGLLIDGYLPGPESYGLKPSGVEASLKYNYLSPARDDFGLSGYYSINYNWLDPHSGRDKDELSGEAMLLAQKYFMEGQLVWTGNAGMEVGYAERDAIAGLPAGFEWSTDPEVEVELKFGTGLSYRFAPNWSVGAETVYETEFETEVGQERWSLFLGPSVHYGSQKWWATFTWFPQIIGGGEKYPGQNEDLHLIEKTKEEFRFRVGFNF